MKLKQIIDEDFSNYKVPSMLIAFPKCSFKCGESVCHNHALSSQPDIEISVERIVERYLQNPITSALVCGGLEPFDSYEDLVSLIREFRKHTDDDIVIYTGYEEGEISRRVLRILRGFKNIIVKFGRFIPNQTPHYDETLGVNLASDNQYARRIS